MVPIRFIAENMGAEVKWIAETKTLTRVINKEIEDFDTPPIIVNGWTLVPLRYVSEKMNANVIWFPKSKFVYISK